MGFFSDRRKIQRTKVQPDNWRCPQCGKNHAKPHWQDKRQEQAFTKTEYMSEPWCKRSDPGERLERGKVPKPLFCPHCGYVEERVLIMRIGA